MKLLMLIWCAVLQVTGAVYYVDFVAGSDSNNGTTTGTPFKRCPGDSSATGTAASTTPAAGDTVAFKGGVTYNSGTTISLKSSGTQADRITYDGNYPGWGDGSKAIMITAGFNLNDRNYNIIQNFEATEISGSFVIQSPGSGINPAYNIIRTNYIHDFPGVGGEGAITLWNSFTNEVTDNVFEYINTFRDGFGTHTGGASATVLTDSTKSWTVNEFVGKIIYNHEFGDASGTITANTATTITCSGGLSGGGTWSNGDAYGIKGSGRGATYFQCNYNGSDCLGDATGNIVARNTITGGTGDSPLFFFGQHNLTVVSNLVYDLQWGSPHSQGMTHYNAAGGNATISHNFYDGTRAWLAMEGLAGATVNVFNNIANCHTNVSWAVTIWQETSGTVRFFNNTLLGGSSDDSVFIGTTGGLFGTRVFQNNIATGGINEGGTQDHNCYTKDTASGTGTIRVTDWSLIFEDSTPTSAGDYQIKSTFAGKDAGSDLSASGVTDDYAGTSRPQGSGFDMGAFEYAGGGGSSGASDVNVTELRIGTIQVAP